MALYEEADNIIVQQMVMVAMERSNEISVLVDDTDRHHYVEQGITDGAVVRHHYVEQAITDGGCS